ncbi:MULTISPECIES: TetR/AcrR family transcriptional regulator [unclassified Caulobacter]|uniref:TetR/AcrR family transcriptional regulator n=1 Tax=unclassified Caulobacter TaxID=2648921 RepID=UPI0006F1D286|nr:MULTISPECIES: TetR/AcrR family transcriptional regulator [unclassified Caulobacter]KQV58841.1 TetR family transcriptional regulator [Caulobacter sp. Root342]KQV68649.1 TetR family transcriptional regulator [Caulobacter sp. Root343]
MSEESETKARKPRADSLRNRDLLLAAAKAAFAEIGAEAPLEDVARRAGVGIGTLYRHFPTREALLAAVYAREIAQLVASAETLTAERPAGPALEAWLDLLIDYVATKRVVAPALRADPGEGARLYETSGATLLATMQRLIAAAHAAGDIRPDITYEDILRMTGGIWSGYEHPGWEAGARRLLDVMMTGLRARAG